MAVIIPSKKFAHYEMEVTLDGTPYIIIRKWNSRGGFWIMNWLDRNRNVLVNGLKIVVNYELIKWYPDRGLPPGLLIAVDDKATTGRIQRNDFTNGRLSLVYYEESEIL